MAIFASTTTSGYSDPLKAMSIRALEQRQKDLLAQQAQQQPDAAMMATIPGGIGHVLGQIGDKMERGRADQALAAQREQLARTIAGIDLEKGPNPQQVAALGADPELQKQWLTTLAENRRQQAQLKSQADLQTGSQTFQSGEKKLDRTQQAELATQQQTHATSQADRQIQATRDLATQAQRANADLAQAERDVKIAEAALDRASKSGDQGAMIAAQSALEDKKAGHAQALATVNNTSQEKIAGGQQATSAANVATQVQSQEKIAAGQQATSTANVATQVASQEKIAAANAAAKAAETAGDPQRAKAVAELGTSYAQQSQAVEKLEKAVNILNNGGINTGPWARAETMAANLASGRFGTDKEMAQRTTDFNSLINEATIKTMSETLKGQTTNFEMEKFLEVMNNPNSSPEARKEGVERLLNAAKVGRDLSREAVRKTGGNVDLIDSHLKGGGGGGAAGGGGGGGGGALQEAQDAINAGANFDAVVQRAQKAGLNASGLKQKGM